MSGQMPQRKHEHADRFDLANLNKRLQLRLYVARCLRKISDKTDPTHLTLYYNSILIYLIINKFRSFAALPISHFCE